MDDGLIWGAGIMVIGIPSTTLINFGLAAGKRRLTPLVV
jgi:hypothetical protein